MCKNNILILNPPCNIQPHLLGASAVLPELVFLHWLYQHSMAPPRPKIFNYIIETPQCNTTNISGSTATFCLVNLTYRFGASFLGLRGISWGSSLNSYSCTLGCKFLDFGRPGPGPGPWLPLPSSFCFLGFECLEVTERSASFSFRNLLSPFLSCQSVRICNENTIHV